MNNQDKSGKSPRQYPPIYEKVIPVAMVVILLAIILLLVLIFLIATGNLVGIY